MGDLNRMIKQDHKSWWGRWVCTICGINESEKFKTRREALDWATTEEKAHVICGIHVRKSKVKL